MIKISFNLFQVLFHHLYTINIECMAATPTSSNKHILDRTQPTSTLRVKFAATVVVARRRLKPAGPDVLKLSELVNSDNTENRVGHIFGTNDKRVFTNGWELLMGQSEVQNHLRSTPDQVKLMRYGGEYKFAGGAVDPGESLEVAARRELEEEFLCEVPADAKLRLFDVKQTRPVRNTSYIMHNFVCLESENEWLRKLNVEQVNLSLQKRRDEFAGLKSSGAYWLMEKNEKELVSPEVYNVEWLDMKTAITHAFQSMNTDITYVNTFQKDEFQRLRVEHRDPLYITMTVMTALDAFSGIEEITAFTDSFDCDVERERVRWLEDGATPEEVARIMHGRAADKDHVHPGAGKQGSGNGNSGGGGTVAGNGEEREKKRVKRECDGGGSGGGGSKM